MTDIVQIPGVTGTAGPQEALVNTWLKGGLLAAAAFKLFAPEVVPSFDGPQEPPYELPGHTVYVNGVELFVREAGPSDAPTIVLVHGWGDESLVVFPRIVPLLADDFHLVLVDNRNNGKSDHVRGNYGIDAVAAELDGVLEELGVTDATVFGFSMGGLIAQELARSHPHRVSRLGLSGTAAAVPPLATVPKPVAAVGTALVRAVDRLSRTELSWLRTKYLVSVGAVAPEHARWAYAAYQNRDPELYWASAWAIAHFDSRPWVGDLDLPTMVVITTNDQLMAPRAQRQLAGLLDDPIVHEVAGRHEAPLTHAAEYARYLRDFATST